MLLGAVTSTAAEVSINIGLPRVNIGINLPMFPNLVQVPGFPVYYAPRLSGNYFFYDGMYWVYQDDTWYTSSWYNGPWGFVEPEYVPLFILRVPVRYYHQHPAYFRGWRPNEPPRWGEHWGRSWENSHNGWDKWERSSAPTPAPLPVYQRQYSGSIYPQGEEQQTLHRQKYRYEPRDTMVRQQSQRQSEQKAPAPVQREIQKEPAQKNPKQPDSQRSAAPQQKTPAAPSAQAAQRGSENVQRPARTQAPQQQRGPANDQRQQPVTAQHERQAPTAQEQGQKSPAREESPKPRQARGQEQKKDTDKERDQDRNR